MRAVIALAFKDLRLLWRDKAGLFWVIAFPLLIALFFGSIFGGGGDDVRSLKIATIREDTSPLAQKFYAELAKSSVLDVRSLPRDSARLLVQRGSLTAYVELIGGGTATFDMLDNPPTIQVGIDPSRKAEAGYLNGLVNQAYFTLLQTAMMDTKGWREQITTQRSVLSADSTVPEHDRQQLLGLYAALDSLSMHLDAVNADTTGDSATGLGMTGPKIKFTDISVSSARPRSAFEITFPQSLQWALIGCAAAFGLSIVTERRRGTWMRLRLAPITRAHILAGKGLACFLASFFVCLLLMVIGVVVFKVQIASVVWLLLIALASAAICFVGLMMLMSVLGKTEASVAGVGWAMFLVFSMIGGGMVPLMFMPSWMLSLSKLSPVRWSILAAEGASWRGLGPSEMLVPVTVLLGVGIIGFAVGVYVLRRSD